MKKIFFLLVLLTGITAQLCAQSNEEKTFELPANSIQRKFTINLDKGNKMQVEITDANGLEYLKNIDSLLQVFIDDIRPLKDSLAGELYSRRIDYLIDTSAVKKIRVQKFSSKGSNFVVTNGEAASLKLEQDTITITGRYSANSQGVFFRRKTITNYYRVSFFLNDLNDLTHYMDGLNGKITTLEQHMNDSWAINAEGNLYIKKHPDILAASPRGYVGSNGDQLILHFSIDAQNYKNYFVPSASLGFIISSSNNFVKREFGFESEMHFLFSKNDSGKLQTFRNTFLTLSYGRTSTKEKDSRVGFNVFPYISLGYLVKRRGDYYDKNTFKVGLGKVSLFGGTTKIEPTLYFNNFFKGVTPSLRIVQNF